MLACSWHAPGLTKCIAMNKISGLNVNEGMWILAGAIVLACSRVYNCHAAESLPVYGNKNCYRCLSMTDHDCHRWSGLATSNPCILTSDGSKWSSYPTRNNASCYAWKQIICNFLGHIIHWVIDWFSLSLHNLLIVHWNSYWYNDYSWHLRLTACQQ